MTTIQCGGMITPAGVNHSCAADSEWLVESDLHDMLPWAVCSKHLHNAVTVASHLAVQEGKDETVKVTPR